MSELTGPLDAADFGRHAAFVRSLARRLSADEAAADDLAQDAWLAAVRKPPAQAGRMRAWLARVLRNQAAERVRSADRRRAREADAVREGAAPDTSELVERIEVHRRVVEAMLALPEAYRAVIVRRYAEDESPAEIAARLGLPEATVRTQLRRGLERLRERLRRELGGTPALFLAALGKLTGDAPTVAPPLPARPPWSVALPTTQLVLSLIMKKAILLVAVGLAAVALVWSVTVPGAKAPEPPAGAREVVAAPAALEPAEALPPIAGFEAGAVARAEVEAPAPEPVAAAAAEPAPPEDPEGRVTIRVEDPFGNPVAGARLEATCWRSAEDPASSVSWPGDSFMGESGPDGVVALRYTREQTWGNVPTQTVASVGFRITQPDYITHEEWDLDVAEDSTVIVLQRGSFLIVSGWIDSPEQTIVDVEPHLSFDVDVQPADWIPVRDGRPSCNRIPPGAHSLYLSHVDLEGRTWYSEAVPFELVEGEQKELALELVPPRAMVGVLDERVPRPVMNGEVELNLYVGRRGGPGVMLRSHRAEVQPDGTFRFDALPPGRGEIIGLCDGWSSAPTRLADSNWYEDENGQRGWRPMWELQQVDPADHEDVPFVLAMARTADAAVTVLDPEGEPVAGASVAFWPNVQWSIGYSQIFLEREWNAITNAEGVALVTNMPAEDAAYFAVTTDEGYLMPLRERGANESRSALADLAPGETAEVTLRMDPPEDER